MPDRRWSRPLLLLASLAVAGSVATASAAIGQETPGVSNPEEWTESVLQSPFSGNEATVRAATFPISGKFVKSEANRFERIVSVRVTFEGAEDPTTPNPSAETSQFQCVPDDPEPFGPSDAPVDNRISFSFTVPAAASTWPCNGTYRVTASALSNQETATYDLTGLLRVEVPPAPIPQLEATVVGGDAAPDPETGATGDDPATVAVKWTQLPDPETAYPDFVGYRIQRAGPAGDANFETVSAQVIDHDHSTDVRAFSDTIEAPGEYRYRVLSLRAGADGPAEPVASVDAPSVSVEIAGPPTTTTTEPAGGGPNSTRDRLALPDVGRGTNNPRAPLTVPGVPTTIDTGFEETIDYGELPEPGEELAGEGQSVIQNESEGAGLLGPVAGALVLLGWAGHVAYLNRLAKQF